MVAGERAHSHSTTWIGDRDVASTFTVADVIPILRDAFAGVPRGEAQIMPRSHLRWDGGLLHVVGAALPGAQVSGVKTWTWTPNGSKPIVVVFSTVDGSLRGIVEASMLGRLRTAATAGLGTDLLARRDARVLAVIGTGRQALAQVQAVLAVRAIEQVRVVGRDADRRAAFAETVRADVGVAVSDHVSAADALQDADVVTTVTRSPTPVLAGELLRDGMHVNAVGAIVPTSAELDSEAVRRCTTVAVESRVQARADAGDLRAAADAGALNWDEVSELGDLVADEPARRPEDITLMRTLGVGLADIAVAAAILDRLAGMEGS